MLSGNADSGKVYSEQNLIRLKAEAEAKVSAGKDNKRKNLRLFSNSWNSSKWNFRMNWEQEFMCRI